MKSVLVPQDKHTSVEVRLLYCLNTRDGTCKQISVEQSLFNASVQPPDNNKQGHYTWTWQLPSSPARKRLSAAAASPHFIFPPPFCAADFLIKK